MAGKKKQQVTANKYEEPDEAESWEEGEVAANEKEPEADLRLRDWRDVERYREIKELRKIVDEDDYAALEAIFPKPVRNPDPRTTGRPRSKAAKPVAAKPASAAPAGKAVAPVKPAPAGKPAPAAKAAPAVKPAAKIAPAKPEAKGLLAKMVAKLTKPARPEPKKAAKPAKDAGRPKAAKKPAAKAKPKAKKKR